MEPRKPLTRGGEHGPQYQDYGCGSYRQLTRDCTIHYIKTSIVEKLILTEICEVSAYVRKDEKRLCSLLPFALSVAGI